MPVKSCSKDGKPGFKWGDSGKCYVYNNEQSRKQAITKAQKQGRAIKAKETSK